MLTKLTSCFDHYAGTIYFRLYLVLYNNKPLAEAAAHAKLFAINTYAPYVRRCRSLGILPGKFGGGDYAGYINDWCEPYPDGYNDPFTIGVWWKAPDQ